jgi:hypothetical protein
MTRVALDPVGGKMLLHTKRREHVASLTATPVSQRSWRNVVGPRPQFRASFLFKLEETFLDGTTGLKELRAGVLP